jgi:hypothetical protein
MGGIDRRIAGTIIDGDEFFNTEVSSLLEGDQESSEEFLKTFSNLEQCVPHGSTCSNGKWTSMLWEEYRHLMEYGIIGRVILFQIANKILSNSCHVTCAGSSLHCLAYESTG